MKTKFLYCIWLAFLLGMATIHVRAQTTITSGSYVIVATGTTLTTLQDMYVNDGANLTINGIVFLKKHLVNQNTMQHDIGMGTIEFAGDAHQKILGQNIVQNLNLNNYEGLTIGGTTRINGEFTFTDGSATLGSNNLLLGPLATVEGSINYKRMFIATGSGELRKEFSGPGSFMFPVGDRDGTHEYSPVTLIFNYGSFPAGNYAGVNLVNSYYPDPNISGNLLKRYWNISKSGISAFNCNVLLQYTADDVSGNEASMSCTRVNPLPWTTYSLANTTLHQLSANGVTGFGSFTGLKSTTPPVNQVLANIGVGSGVTTCYDATQVLTLAGSGNTFTVSNGGSVTLIAGVKISMLPGVRVYPGGYLHGYITLDETYCSSMFNPLVTNPVSPEITMAVPESEKSFIVKIYPNPTADMFTVECRNAGLTSKVDIDIFSMHGQHIASKSISGELKHQFSLAGMPVGFYMIHARSESQSEIVKIIKY
jgi:hypothetical protein